MKTIFFLILVNFVFSIVGVCQNKTDTKYNWDLSSIYSGWDDWQKDLDLLKSQSFKYAQFEGKLVESSYYLLNFKKFDDTFLQLRDKLLFYVSLKADINSRNSLYTSKLRELQTVIVDTEKRKRWIEPELAKIPKEKVFSLMKDNHELLVYKHQFDKFYNQLDHIIDKESMMIASYYTKAADASSNIFKSLSSSDMQYDNVILSDGTFITANPANASKIYATNQSQQDRKLVFEALEKSYTKNKYTYAEIWIGIAQSRWADAQLKGYESCLDAVLKPENISKDIYLNLLDIAGNNTSTLIKYRELRKKILGLKTYYGSDESIDLINSKSEYKYDSAINIVLEALKPMGEEYSNLLISTFQAGKIDVYEKPGKFIGAYNWSKYGLKPYILLNWKDTRNDIFVLAHELGHAMHSILSDGHQPYCNSYYSPMIAETAALFNEMMLLDYLIKTAKDNNEKLALLVKAIDNLSRGFYRQSQFAEFEYSIYNLIERDEQINADILANLFSKIDNKFNGGILQRSEYHPFSWTKIHHFCNSYYYLYNYAVSYAVSNSLYDQILKAKNEKEANSLLNRYFDLLKSGGNDYPVVLLKKAGVDLTTKDPFFAVVERLENLLYQLEVALKHAEKI